MNYVIIFSFVLVLMLCWTYTNSKNLSYCAILILFVITCFSYDPYDYLNYKEWFQTIADGYSVEHERFFEYMFKVSSYIGLDYDQLRIIITVIELFFVHNTITRYTSSCSLVWSLYIVYPAWLLTTLFRFNIGLCVLLYGIRYLIENPVLDSNKRRATLLNVFYDINIYKYLLCVLVASLFHDTLMIFALLAIVRIARPKTVLVSSIVLLIVLGLLGNMSLFSEYVSHLHVRERITEKFNTSDRNFNGIAYAIVRQGFICLAACIPVKFYEFNNRESGEMNRQDLFMKTIMPLNFASIMFVAVSFLSGNTRLSFLTVILNIIAYGVCIENRGVKSKVSLILKIIAALFVLSMSALMCNIESHGVFNLIIIQTIFESNTLINI